MDITPGDRVWVRGEESFGTVREVDEFSVIVRVDSDGAIVSAGHGQCVRQAEAERHTPDNLGVAHLNLLAFAAAEILKDEGDVAEIALGIAKRIERLQRAIADGEV